MRQGHRNGQIRGGHVVYNDFALERAPVVVTIAPQLDRAEHCARIVAALDDDLGVIASAL